jgi:hypothetical protein
MPVPDEVAVAVGVGAAVAVMPLLSQVTVKALPLVSVEDGEEMSTRAQDDSTTLAGLRWFHTASRAG